MKSIINKEEEKKEDRLVCPLCKSQNLATITKGIYSLGFYFGTKSTDKKCLTCDHEFTPFKGTITLSHDYHEHSRL